MEERTHRPRNAGSKPTTQRYHKVNKEESAQYIYVCMCAWNKHWNGEKSGYKKAGKLQLSAVRGQVGLNLNGLPKYQNTTIYSIYTWPNEYIVH